MPKLVRNSECCCIFIFLFPQRKNKTYIRVYLICSNFIVQILIPFITLVLLNFKTYQTIKESEKKLATKFQVSTCQLIYIKPRFPNSCSLGVVSTIVFSFHFSHFLTVEYVSKGLSFLSVR